MHLVDLMPATSRARLRGKSATRRWAIAYGAAGGLLIALTGSLRLKQMTDGRTRDRLLREVALDEDYARQIAAIRDESSKHREAIERHSRIAWPVDLSDVISVVAEVMPESVSLTSMTVTPKMEVEKLGKSDGPPAALSLAVELAGVAPTDLEVAALIAGLEERGLFERVAMDHARQADIGGVKAREFGLTCEIDLLSRRRAGTERLVAETPK